MPFIPHPDGQEPQSENRKLAEPQSHTPHLADPQAADQIPHLILNQQNTDLRDSARTRYGMNERSNEQLSTLKTKHPTNVADSQPAIYAAWLKLTEAEQTEAHSRYDEWLVRVQKHRRHICGLDKYLAEKRWTLLPKRAASYIHVDMFTKRWFAVIALRVSTGDVGRLGFFADQQRDGRGWPVLEPDLAALDAVPLVRVEAQSPEANAWWRWLDENGCRLQPPERVASVGFPTTLPPGEARTSAKGRTPVPSDISAEIKTANSGHELSRG